MVLLKIIGLVGGGETPYDGQYLKAYDPNREGTDPNGEELFVHLATTPNAEEAMHFADVEMAFDCWKQIPERYPLRSDGKPNRPLTAFTVTIEPVPWRV